MKDAIPIKPAAELMEANMVNRVPFLPSDATEKIMEMTETPKMSQKMVVARARRPSSVLIIFSSISKQAMTGKVVMD